MRVSPAGRAAIRQREGCRLSAYRDSRGIWTIGVGHVDMTPPVVTPGMRITEAEADAFLAADLTPVEATINGAVSVPLTQNEFDAMASLGFNIGVGGLRRCTVIGRLNRGDRSGAADAFLLWAHPAELLGRRKAERIQFLTPDAHVVTLSEEAHPASASQAAVTPVNPVAPIAPLAPAGPAKPARAAAAPLSAPAAAPGILSRIASLFVG